MEIRVAQEAGRTPVTIFFVTGSIHLGNAQQLESAARMAVENGTRNLIIDVSEVPSMTSAGLRALHVIYKMLEQNAPREESDGSRTPGKSAHIKLVNPSPTLRRVINIAGFDTFLEIYDSTPEAVASF